MEGSSVFCQRELETRDHLFFGCAFSQRIWKEILKHFGLNREVGWNEELKWVVQRLKGRALISILLRIAWNAFVRFRFDLTKSKNKNESRH